MLCVVMVSPSEDLAPWGRGVWSAGGCPRFSNWHGKCSRDVGRLCQKQNEILKSPPREGKKKALVGPER